MQDADDGRVGRENAKTNRQDDSAEDGEGHQKGIHVRPILIESEIKPAAEAFHLHSHTLYSWCLRAILESNLR